MKKLISVVFIFVLMLVSVGCGANNVSDDAYNANSNEGEGSTSDETLETDEDQAVSEEKTIVDEIKEKGKLVVGTSADYPPYEFHAIIDGTDEIVGFDMDIAQAIADDMGVELEIKDMDFDGLLAALASGSVDMVIAGMTPEPERLEAADFSDIYYTANHGVVVQAGQEELITSFDDLDGKVVGVQQASIQADLAKVQIEAPKEIREVGKITDLVLMLQTGRVDAIIMELPVAESYVKNNDQLALTSIEVEDEQGGSAVAVKKNSPEFVAVINETLADLMADNKIDEFFQTASELADQQ